MKSQLLCTFSTKKDIESTIATISSAYTIMFNKIYVLQNEDNTNELICTYNVDPKNTVDFNDVSGTISLHRKKHSNTLYTINALNELIADFNNGVVDKSFPIPWENFKNMVLVTNSDGLSRIGTRIYKIINTET